MLPRLEAQRELADISAMSAAFGNLRPAERRRYLGRLARLATSGGGRAARPSPESLAAMGVAVVVMPTRSPSDG
jgi:hypothetical protein